MVNNVGRVSYGLMPEEKAQERAIDAQVRYPLSLLRFESHEPDSQTDAGCFHTKQRGNQLCLLTIAKSFLCAHVQLLKHFMDDLEAIEDGVRLHGTLKALNLEQEKKYKEQVTRNQTLESQNDILSSRNEGSRRPERILRISLIRELVSS